MHKNKNNNKKINKKISLTNQKHRIQIVNLISCQETVQIDTKKQGCNLLTFESEAA